MPNASVVRIHHNARDVGEAGLEFWVEKIPQRRKPAAYSSALARKNPRQKNMAGSVQQGHKDSRHDSEWLNMHLRCHWGPVAEWPELETVLVSVASAEEPVGSGHSAEPTGRWWRSKVPACIFVNTHTHPIASVVWQLYRAVRPSRFFFFSCNFVFVAVPSP